MGGRIASIERDWPTWRLSRIWLSVRQVFCIGGSSVTARFELAESRGPVSDPLGPVLNGCLNDLCRRMLRTRIYLHILLSIYSHQLSDVSNFWIIWIENWEFLEVRFPLDIITYLIFLWKFKIQNLQNLKKQSLVPQMKSGDSEILI